MFDFEKLVDYLIKALCVSCEKGIGVVLHRKWLRASWKHAVLH